MRHGWQKFLQTRDPILNSRYAVVVSHVAAPAVSVVVLSGIAYPAGWAGVHAVFIKIEFQRQFYLMKIRDSAGIPRF